MPDTPYTQAKNFQYRGPQRSEDFNEMKEQQMADLVFLYNKINQVDFDSDKKFSADSKNLVMLARMLDNFETRIEVLEGGLNRLNVKSQDQIDNARFDSVPAYTVASADRLNYDTVYGFITLPREEAASISKMRYENEDGTFGISSFLEMNVVTDGSSADDSDATIDTSPPYYAVQNLTGKIWERNVIRANVDPDGAILYLYVKLPEDLFVNDSLNNIQFTPFPMYGVDVLDVSYTTTTSPQLTSSGTWIPLNQSGDYFDENEAIGHIPPGGWSGDTILNSGMKSFYFDPRSVTAFRIKLRQLNYFVEGGQYIYTYGLSKLDARLDKFSSTGKTIIKFDIPSGDTISSVDALIPKIWNVSASEVDDIVSTRVIWETSYNSGSYTLSPVPFSRRVWVEVTLNETLNGGTPVLSDLILEYS